MRMLLAAVAATLAAPAPGLAQDRHACPMTAGARQQAVDHRHHEATGIPGKGTRHRFLLAEDGGSIRLEVTDPADATTRDRIRAHLRHIARAFAAGDFDMPERIHGQVPPGVEAMKAHGASIRYVYSETPGGGTVSIRTADPAARAAVQEFLRFQIEDHGTGDPRK